MMRQSFLVVLPIVIISNYAFPARKYELPADTPWETKIERTRKLNLEIEGFEIHPISLKAARVSAHIVKCEYEVRIVREKTVWRYHSSGRWAATWLKPYSKQEREVIGKEWRDVNPKSVRILNPYGSEESADVIESGEFSGVSKDPRGKPRGI